MIGLARDVNTDFGRTMSKITAILRLGICFSLAACTDAATSSRVYAPHVQPSLNAAAAVGYILTPFGSDESITLAADVGIEQAATGGRASGHFELAEPFFSILTEQYSFIALSTDGFPNAKGELDAKIARSTLFQDLHAEVDCLAIAGNQAWISGALKRLLFNGVPQPTANRYVVWRVQAHGE